MERNTEYPTFSVGLGLLAASLAGTMITFMPSHTILPIGMGDGLLLALIAIHAAWGIQLFLTGAAGRRVDEDAVTRAAEVLFFFGAFLFIFAYIFASNANMDYVQRYIAGGGTIQLAPDTRTERLLVAGRYGPFLVVDAFLLGLAMLRTGRSRAAGKDTPGWNAPLLMVLSLALSVLANPSFVHLEGYGALGWVALTPLFVLIRREVVTGRALRAGWYGLLYGVFFTLLGNYWLGTFNLISLQAVGVIFFAFYLLYLPVPIVILAFFPKQPTEDSPFLRVLRALVLPLSWTAFELARSSGFLGYPWLLVAHSQYRFPLMIQTARWGGVWMVSLIVLMVNALLAEALLSAAGTGRRRIRYGVHTSRLKMSGSWVLAAAGLLAMNGLTGLILLRQPPPTGDSVRIALIQQNTDPRKTDYLNTLDILKNLTNQALAVEPAPELIVWSETAFVPNIRRWSAEDPRRNYLAGLVTDLLDYQSSLATWLLTGNDDYRRQFDAEGKETGRDSYNAAVLFSDTGERRETYHKVKLVPFTEHFPYRDTLPWVYQMLQNVDITFWTPGEEFTIFRHPKFAFAAPICFEDVFPWVAREFARNGMEVIVNITNDYWSLQEQAAQQHAAAALFRTVELATPMVRATASGLTTHIDAQGRIRATVPQYSEEFLIADVAISPQDASPTLYQRRGDWLPWTALLLVVVIAGFAIVARYNCTITGVSPDD